MGLILEEDIPFLLSELKAEAFIEEQWKIAFLVRDLLLTNPWTTLSGFDQVVAAARTNPALAEMLQPVLGPVEWPSAEAERLKAGYEAGRLRREKVPQPELPLQDKLRAALAMGDDRVFEHVCLCLLGDSLLVHERDDELLPHWTSLGVEIQGSVVEAAAAYLKTKCRVDGPSSTYLRYAQYHIMYRFWALRLLSVSAPDAFDSIGKETWHDWMPCVFGDVYSPSVVDARHVVVLATAHRFAPDRFIEVIEDLIEGQNAISNTVCFLDRLLPLWDDKIAALLRVKLNGHGISRGAFREILGVLLPNDVTAVQFATDLVANTPADDNSLADEGVDVDRPLAAAFQLLSINVAGAWPMVWRAVEKNGHFAREFFAQLALDPNSKTALDVVRCVQEHQLADMYIWVARNSAPTRRDHEFGIITPEKALAWLGRVVIDGLARRGTPEASRQIRRIKESVPGEPLEFLTRSTEELVRRNTWRPMSTRQFLDLVLPSNPSRTVESSPSSSDSPPAPAAVPIEAANPRQRVAKNRADWLDRQLSCRPEWSSDLDIHRNGGPTYNTIQRYRSGKKSAQEKYVRNKLASALGTDISEVPE
jgi:hypothetical protein